VGCRDSFSKVDGKGISMLRAAGIEVVVGVVEDSCRELNRRFFTLHEKKRPYVILKWAESKDGFIGNIHIPNQPISNAVSRQRTHLWRAQEQAILIGANTALVDNPTLTTRLVTGKNPQRFVIDLHQRTPITHHLVSDELPTTFFNFKGTFQRPNEIKNSVILQEGKVLDQVINHLFEQSIQSVIVEGGATTISHFIDAGIWDEARVFTSNQELKEGISAPPLRNAQLASSEFIRDGEHIDELTIYHNSTQLFR
jgi:diaminohydroxyphosphoribosylaminopyrimidine deaminase/5-amino-6-(5-phosphoribosylamino)uracil reductase